MLEAIHSAAYASNTLGLPKMCPSENVEGSITRQVLGGYLHLCQNHSCFIQYCLKVKYHTLF